MNQNEKIERAIKIIYLHYETMQDKSIKCIDREAIVRFSKDSTEYVINQSYKDNMEAMLLDIFENGFVFINDNVAIPVFNIKQFMSFSFEDKRQESQDKTQKKERIPITENRHFNRWNNKRKFKGKSSNGNGNGKEQSQEQKVISVCENSNDNNKHDSAITKEQI
jgi:hypothetical protein